LTSTPFPILWYVSWGSPALSSLNTILLNIPQHPTIPPFDSHAHPTPPDRHDVEDSSRTTTTATILCQPVSPKIVLQSLECTTLSGNQFFLRPLSQYPDDQLPRSAFFFLLGWLQPIFPFLDSQLLTSRLGVEFCDDAGNFASAACLSFASAVLLLQQCCASTPVDPDPDPDPRSQDRRPCPSLRVPSPST